jgi:hypothetical protein
MASQTPQIFSYNGKNYYSLKELVEYDIDYFQGNGCKSQPSKIIHKKNI